MSGFTTLTTSGFSNAEGSGAIAVTRRRNGDIVFDDVNGNQVVGTSEDVKRLVAVLDSLAL